MKPGSEAVRYRLSLDGAQRFLWRKGDRIAYGLWRIAEFRKKVFVCWWKAKAIHGPAGFTDIPAVSIPANQPFGLIGCNTLME
jgi:hypothetical protein